MKVQCYLDTEEGDLIVHNEKKTNYEKSSFWAGFKEPHRISWSKDKVVVIPIMEEWEMLALLYKNLITQGKC